MHRTVALLSLVTAVAGSGGAASAVGLHLPISIGAVTGAPSPQARVPCPSTITFSAVVSTKPFGRRPSTEIDDRWVRSDGSATPEETVVSTGTNPVTLHDAWFIDHPIANGYDQLVTGYPCAGSSPSDTFGVACHAKAS